MVRERRAVFETRVVRAVKRGWEGSVREERVWVGL